MDSFTVAAKRYGKVLETSAVADESKAQEACRMVAIGFLARKSKSDINSDGRDASGVTKEIWNTGKGAFSKAWRSLGGEYGFGDDLANQWASGDFSVALEVAYKLSAAPKEIADKVAQVVKLFCNLTASEQSIVLSEAIGFAHEQALKYQDIQSIVKENMHKMIAA
jgi:hypothetical protein